MFFPVVIHLLRFPQFVQLDDITVVNATFSMVVPRDTMLTLTTTTGQRKGVAASVTKSQYRPFPLPYSTGYETDALFKPARFHADNEGTFEVLPDARSEGGGGQVLVQTAPL